MRRLWRGCVVSVLGGERVASSPMSDSLRSCYEKTVGRGARPSRVRSFPERNGERSFVARKLVGITLREHAPGIRLPDLMTCRFSYALHELKQGPLVVNLDLGAAWLNDALADTDVVASDSAKGAVHCSLVLVGRDVIVRGHVDATIALPCARCLHPTEVSIRGKLALVLKPESQGDPVFAENYEGEREFTSQEAEYDTYRRDQIVLDDFIREAILLELPIFPLCSESCTGIDAASEATSALDGFDEPGAIDPRFAPLLKLKKEH